MSSDTIRLSNSLAPLDDPFQVNTFETGDQDQSSVTVLQDGSAVVVWRSYSSNGVSIEIFGQRLDAEGETLGVEFQINQSTADYSEDRPSVVSLDIGGFNVSWGGPDDQTYGRAYDASGVGGVQYIVGDLPADYNTSLAFSGNGGSLYAGSTDLGDGTFSVFGQGYDAAGNEVGDPIEVGQFASGDIVGGIPQTIALDGGSYLVLWYDEQDEGFGETVTYIRGRIVNADLSMSENTISVEVNSLNTGRLYTATSTSDGQFLLFWQDETQAGTFSLLTQAFDISGNTVGAINTAAISGSYTPILVADFSEDRVLVFSPLSDSEVQGGGFRYLTQVVDADGTPIGEPAETVLPNYADQITSSGDERFITASGDAEVFAQFLELSFTIDGTSGPDTLLGSSSRDIIHGGDGTDRINGGAGDDFIFGGATDADLRDVIYAGSGDDVVDAGHGNDLVYGMDGNDTISGGFGADKLVGQNGDDVISGGAYSDLIFGGAGDDFVNGGWGHDRVNGGSGADKFYHLGIADHGSDWVQDYLPDEGDVLLFGDSDASASDFQVNYAHTATPEGERSGDDDVMEAFVIYQPTGQIMWALVGGASQAEINLQIAGTSDVFDLLA